LRQIDKIKEESQLMSEEEARKGLKDVQKDIAFNKQF